MPVDDPALNAPPADAAPERLPVVPLRDNVVFPQQLAPLAAGRSRSVAGLQVAANGDARVILAVQKDAHPDDVALDDLHPIAVVATVGALRLLPGSGAHALVEGQQRVRLRSFEQDGDHWSATSEAVADDEASDTESDALAGSVRQLFAEYVTAGGQVGPEVAAAMARAIGPARVADIASAAPDLTVAERVELLQTLNVVQRLRRLAPLLGRQVEVASMRTRIHDDVTRTINKSQREHILREQLRAVRKELAELDGESDDAEDLTGRIEALGMPPAVRVRALKEVARLEQIPSASPELGMVRSWVDWLLDLPWGEPPAADIDIDRAAAILDEDHYGLAKVKDRILEWMAVRDRAQRRAAASAAAADAASSAPVTADGAAEIIPAAIPDHAVPGADSATDERRDRGVDLTTRPPRVLQTPILCLVGPPGVGKTSLGRSIARAMDRRFVRLSLGGIRDEAEIRGHRRTYIGALPGRIIQSMKQAGTVNPVIMLDEIDKVGTDFRGDPSAALLEVLDPEQNREFSDHYLEVPYDLSKVLFITTANMVDTISPALRDRMEVIRISGYTEAEKLGIAERHLLPRQLEQHGLDNGELTIPHDTLVSILRGYTREAGVRQLDRTIAEIARKVPRRLAGGVASVVVQPAELSDFIGPQRFEYGEAQEVDEVGAVTGVVVSEVGGDIVTVEVLAIQGSPDLSLTGQLGAVMEESAKAALSWARVHAIEYGAPRDFFDTHALHVHVPAGAIPKDGPSAGVTMVTAMVSVASGRPVRRDVAMTGEVTLRGRVLPIGGVKDKLLAAHRSGLTTFILPRKNMRDLDEIPQEVLDTVEVVPADNVQEVLARALVDAPAQRRERRTGFMLPLRGDDPPRPTITA
ncbi:MAG: endopeptidase La [Candidatus Dormibacteraeota bacterium]|uniref:Lon protease n=1 Tax=Candidatus Amunia macphersoniae TaxID=3127014 RepID=A0A934KDH9_9BACT|nr:endopeptidase La [Candidatus Dormibacteraeota bacterium]